MSTRPRRREKQQQSGTSLPTMAGFFLFCTATAFVILALTGYTYQLDDIKVVGLWLGGGVSLAAWAGLVAFRQGYAPPPIIWGSYLAFLFLGVVSTLIGQPYVRWIGWEYLLQNAAVFGFILLGASVVTTHTMVEWMLKFWVLITFVTTGFGLIHYFGLLETYYQSIYPFGPEAGVRDRFHDVLNTFRLNRQMLSTVLNVQFFGNFLLMCLPMTAAGLVVASRNLRARIDAGEALVGPLFWLIVSALSVTFASGCILLTFVKSSIGALPLVILLFFGGLYFLGGIRRIPYLWLMGLLGAILVGVVLSLAWADLAREFKTVEESLGPRAIIYQGALGIFADHPILGAGPGSFRIVFPEYRSPDYHLNRVSNLTLYAHNWVLDLLAENGILGTAAYLIFLGGIFWLAWRALHSNEDLLLRVAIIGAAVGVIAILAGASLTPMTRWPVGLVSLNAMLGTLLGLSMYALRVVEESAEEAASTKLALSSPAGPTPIGWGLVVASLAFAVWSYREGTTFFSAMISHNEGIRSTEFLQVPPGNLQEGSAAFRSYTKGAEAFEEAVALRPGLPTSYYKLGSAYSRIGQPEKSLDAYERMQQYAPDYSEVHYNLAVIHYQLATDALEQLTQARRNGGQAPEALVSTVKKHFNNAVEAFREAGRFSNKISVQFFYANTAYLAASRAGFDEERSKELYREAGEVFQRTARLPISQVLQEAGQAEQEQDLRFRSWSLAAQAYREAGDSLEAARAARAYVDAYPGEEAWLAEGVRLYQQAGANEEALEWLESLLDQNPLDPALQQMKVETLLAAGKKAEALRHGKYLLALDARLRESGETLLASQTLGWLREQVRSLAAEQKEPT